MSKAITVMFAPASEVALIRASDGKLYALTRDGGVREEYAPQMFNLHLDNSRYTVEMEDEYPFEKVRHELTEQVAKGRLVYTLIFIMDAQMSNKTKCLSVEEATEIVRDYPSAMYTSIQWWALFAPPLYV